MKTFYIFTSLLLSAPFAQAQYLVDWKIAPVNPVPHEYTLNHKHIQGKVKTRTRQGMLSFTETYDQKGKLISNISKFANETNEFDGNGHLIKVIHDTYFANVTTNDKGFITEFRYNDGSGHKFEYDKQGLYVKKKNLDNTPNQHMTYDDQNRIKKLESFDQDGKVYFSTIYTYQPDGNFTKVIKTYTDQNNTPPQTFYFDPYGHQMSKKEDPITYDAHGNVMRQADSQMLYSETFEYSYYESAEKNQPLAVNKDPKCTEGNCINGYGVYKFDNGTYVGFFENGKREGYGGYTWETGSKFVGDWKNGIIDGYGLVNFSNGSWQKGIFKNAKLEGLGIEYFKDSNRAQYGIYSEGKLTTEYAYNANTQNTEKGCLAGDCYNGYGKFVYDNGGKFIGFYKNGFMLQGTWYASNGSVYVGQFGEGNQYNGFGNYIDANGEAYSGYYKNGKRHGKGMLFNKNTNHIKKGIWQDEVLTTEY